MKYVQDVLMKYALRDILCIQRYIDETRAQTSAAQTYCVLKDVLKKYVRRRILFQTAGENSQQI